MEMPPCSRTNWRTKFCITSLAARLPQRPSAKREAEAVAFVVCQVIGLETGPAAADYIQLHRGDAKLLLESLNYVRLAAGRILDGILENQTLPIRRHSELTSSVEFDAAWPLQARPDPLRQCAWQCP
jgi:hypothetical protein